MVDKGRFVKNLPAGHGGKQKKEKSPQRAIATKEKVLIKVGGQSKSVHHNKQGSWTSDMSWSFLLEFAESLFCSSCNDGNDWRMVLIN